jgi:hypothetical protein
VTQAILKRLGPVPLRDLPEEWHSDLGRMYEVVSKDALAFVQVPGTGGSGRVPTMNPRGANGGNGSNGHETEDAEAVVSEAGDGAGAEPEAVDS